MMHSLNGSAFTARAIGNQVYLQAGGFAGRPDLLAAFLREHPDSDYAAETQRALAGLETRQRGGFGRVSLQIEIAPDVPEATRLRGVFSERARELYQAAGISLVDGSGAAVLMIRHSEREVAALKAADILESRGTGRDRGVADRRRRNVRLPRSFGIRVPDSDRRRDGSVSLKVIRAVLGSLFVPVASWPTRRRCAPPGRRPSVAAWASSLGRRGRWRPKELPRARSIGSITPRVIALR